VFNHAHPRRDTPLVVTSLETVDVTATYQVGKTGLTSHHHEVIGLSVGGVTVNFDDVVGHVVLVAKEVFVHLVSGVGRALSGPDIEAMIVNGIGVVTRLNHLHVVAVDAPGIPLDAVDDRLPVGQILDQAADILHGRDLPQPSVPGCTAYSIQVRAG